MIPKEIITRAIEGEWKPNRPYLNTLTPSVRDVYAMMNWQEIALDPSFWQALGKALGWKDWFYSYYVANNGIKTFNGHWEPVEQFEDIPEYLRAVKNAWIRHEVDNPEWQSKAQQFYRLILTGGDKTEKGFDVEAMAHGVVPTTVETPSRTEQFWQELLTQPNER